MLSTTTLNIYKARGISAQQEGSDVANADSAPMLAETTDVFAPALRWILFVRQSYRTRWASSRCRPVEERVSPGVHLLAGGDDACTASHKQHAATTTRTTR